MFLINKILLYHHFYLYCNNLNIGISHIEDIE